MFRKAFNKLASMVEKVDFLDKSLEVINTSTQSIVDSVEKLALTVLENRQAINLVLARQEHIIRHLMSMGVDEADLFDTLSNNKDKPDLLN